MKFVIALASAFSSCFLYSQYSHGQPSMAMEKKWETDTVFQIPESVLYDTKREVLYVSNIQGDLSAKDGGGFISKLSPEGKVLQLQWVKGLNSPKGLGLFKKQLYVADLDEVVIIDVDKGRVIQRVPVTGAEMLNDVTVDQQGVVYISDSRTRKLHQLKDGVITTLVENLKGPNGVLATAEAFYILDDGALNQLEKDGTVKKLLNISKAPDGIERISEGEFVISCWPGEVFYVNLATGMVHKMLDTQAQKLNGADIGYNARKRIVYVPTFFGNSVVAYQLKSLLK
ncbi:SMP-30/gluconolactonase/LRE family protein [Chitinophaga defluvii]|uniref:ATP/GTP-binding protein n=1 Tax=Chitinophaga defluvii TaxID=3163343 RepID=A0ABV2T8K7_9BACT